jgi:hypothetical protein
MNISHFPIFSPPFCQLKKFAKPIEFAIFHNNFHTFSFYGAIAQSKENESHIYG